MMKMIQRPKGTQDNKYYASIYEYFLEQKRTIFFYSVMTGFPMRQDQFASWVARDHMLALDTISDEPITLIIDSGGGELDDCFALHDTIKMLRSPVYTVGLFACSAAVAILSAGQKGKRFIIPNGRVMMHLISGGTEGDVKELKKQQKEIERLEERYIGILMNNGITRDRKQLDKDIDREFWLSPKEAVDYGIVDQIVESDWQKTIWG